ncbi:dexh-box atp-dependent rna helicase dexh5 [Quercus suber]|uniref:RNA helicase n=1 Tax=Quercus suber TaxID=58331 RepID=A0AAW0LPR0_QUESU
MLSSSPSLFLLLHNSLPLQNPKTLTMKDRPRSSYGAVYVPPHHRLRSVITTPNYTSSAAAAAAATAGSGAGAGAGAADVVDFKLREPPQTAVISPRQTHSPYSQQEQLHNRISHFNSPRPPPPCDDSVSEEGSDRELDSFPLPLAEAAKYQFSRDYSDHLALVRAYEGWIDAERDLAGYEYCWKNFLSVQSIKAIDSLRKEFFSLLKDTGLVDGNTTSYNAWSHDEHLVRAVICYGLYPGICSVVHNEKSFSLKSMEDGQVFLYSNSVNARESKIPYPWLVFNEKIKVNSVFLRDSTAVSDSVLLLFGGTISRGETDGHLKMLGGFLEFFLNPTLADMYQNLRRELDELIQKKLLYPRMDMHTHHELLSAVRLLVSEDRCDGRFVFGRQVLKPSKPSVLETKTTLISRIESGPGGDNSKSQLQTLLTRAGYSAPTYKTKQLKNNQFRATVEFNGMQIMGQPCNNKKSAEKDAAAEALQWLMGGNQAGHEHLNHMSMLLKKSKKDHN